MLDALVIGKGIFGVTIAKALEQSGRKVLVLDNHEPLAGSPPSGGHMKPSWFSGLGKYVYDPGLETLENLFGFTEEKYSIYPLPKGVSVSVFRLDIDKALLFKHNRAEVTAIDLLETSTPQVTCIYQDKEIKLRCRLLVVAAGVWCQQLLPSKFPKKSLVGKTGVSFRFAGQISPFIKPWAPYRQIVANNVTPDSIWVGDGTAILSKNWTEDRAVVCEARCKSALKITDKPIKKIEGIRPYCAKQKFCVEKIGKAAWVATGAGKHGTVVAGYAAQLIARS